MIRQMGTGGLLGLGNTFRPMSPFQQAADLAHRVARQRLETGGAPGAAPKRAKADLAPRDFVLPLDVDAAEVRKAIEAKLDGSPQPTDAPPILERKAGGNRHQHKKAVQREQQRSRKAAHIRLRRRRARIKARVRPPRNSSIESLSQPAEKSALYRSPPRVSGGWSKCGKRGVRRATTPSKALIAATE